ncbi:uncharacterized protein LOC116349737 [Contarinia nasturtii]|uniref:uncharacterized protein LOC116349737 n=1 Tax=Contarinia nasturtii TaxID=265458 RepID=UPI0012D4281E|nr:uncharacterized protein LOC116349737 [Contarinia nasturtii]
MFNMNSKVICFFALVAAVQSAPQLYPAGVDPALCPGFPICDNAMLHGVPAVPESPVAPEGRAIQQAQPQWSAPVQQARTVPEWTAPVQQAPVQPQWTAPVQQARAEPEWTAPVQQIPVQQVWGAPMPQAPIAHVWNGAPAAQPASAVIYPAGVNPLSCPNYPYCDVSAGVMAAPKVSPLPGYTERLYPAGVNPAECPNYPEC